MNYIWTLLDLYMNNCEHCENVHFTEEINGSEVEWPIGAWLYFTKKRLGEMEKASTPDDEL